MTPEATYLDTNVYNEISSNLKPGRVLTLGLKIKALGLQIYLSPINILEFLMCGDNFKKEQLVFLAQHICEKNILAEVENLLISELSKNLKNPCLASLQLKTPFCISDLNKTWENVHSDIRQTLLVDINTQEAIKAYKNLDALFHAFSSRGGTFEDLSDLKLGEVDYGSLVEMQEQTKTIRKKPTLNKREIKLRSHLIFLTLQILCVGTTPFPQVTDKFWGLLKISDRKLQIDFLLKDIEKLIDNNPLMGMALASSWHATKSYDSGNFFDCFHVGYLPYIDTFWTLDQRLLALPIEFPQIELFKKIKNGPELVQSVLEG